jgi:serine protease
MGVKMRTKSLNKAIMATLLTSSTMISAGEYLSANNNTKVIQNQYIVVLKDDSVTKNMKHFSKKAFKDTAQYESSRLLNNTLSKSFNAEVKYHFQKVLNGGIYNMDKKTAKMLAKDPRVAYVEEDFEVHASAVQSNPTWGLDRIDQTSGSLSGSYQYDTTASNVTAYIIDTGITVGHSQFGGRASDGWDFVDGDSVAQDCNGHGTHVAGTVGSQTYGVAKGVKLKAVRVLSCSGSGSNAGVIQGMDWVTNNATLPAVANMSLGSQGTSTASNAAVQRMVNAGVVLVTASGNDNSDACGFTPGNAPGTINVASTAQGDSRSSFSNYGSCIDIFAPGSNITSTWYNGGTNTISGTSMAAPHVAGVAALYLADNPNSSPSGVLSALQNNATQNAVSGANGSPNLLVNSLFGSTPPPPPPGGTVLSNGVPVTGLSASTGNSLVYTINVPSGASNISFNMSGGSGDADMYVKFGSAPTDSSYDCRPYANGNNENCSGTQTGGTYYVRVKAYSSFSGVSLVANYTTGGSGPTPIDSSISNISVARNQWARYTLALDPGYSNLTVSISGGSGDADLYVRRGAQSTTSAYDCRPYKNGNNETCSFNSPASSTWYIDIRGYSAASGVTLRVQAD